MCLPSDAKGSTIQSVATIVGTLLCLNTGLMIGISEPHTQLYQQTDRTPLNRSIGDAAATWSMSYLFLGATFSALFAGSIANRIGPKSVLLISGLLQITSWFCIHFGFDILHIYAARLFAGIAAGAAFTVLPIFITEISEASSVRLMIYMEQMRAIGIFGGLMMGHFMPYVYVSIVGIGLSSIFSLTFPFVQESPHFYLHRDNIPSFEKSLRWYRGIRNLDDRECPEFVCELMAWREASAQQKQQTTIAKYKSHHYALKLFVLCMVITLCAHFSGTYLVLSYALDFLPAKPASTEFPATATDAIWLLAGAHCLGAWLSTYVMRHLKRKLAFVLAGSVCCLSLIALALSKLLTATFQLTAGQYYSLNFLMLAVNLIASNTALFPLATIISLELLPPKVRASIISLVFPLGWLVSFLLIHYYHNLVWLISMSGIYWFLAACSISLTVLFAICVPETRDMPSDELQTNLGYGLSNETVPKISTISNGHINDAFHTP